MHILSISRVQDGKCHFLSKQENEMMMMMMKKILQWFFFHFTHVFKPLIRAKRSCRGWVNAYRNLWNFSFYHLISCRYEFILRHGVFFCYDDIFQSTDLIRNFSRFSLTFKVTQKMFFKLRDFKFNFANWIVLCECKKKVLPEGRKNLFS